MANAEKTIHIPLTFDTAIGAALLVKPPAKATVKRKATAKKPGRKPAVKK